MKYENKGNCEIFFYNYVGYFPAITHGKFHVVRRQTEVGLWECFFSLRQREKYFSYSFVISMYNMCVFCESGDKGRIQTRGIRVITSFRGCQHACRRETTSIGGYSQIASLAFRFCESFPLTELPVSYFICNLSSLITILQLLFPYNRIYHGVRLSSLNA